MVRVAGDRPARKPSRGGGRYLGDAELCPGCSASSWQEACSPRSSGRPRRTPRRRAVRTWPPAARRSRPLPCRHRLPPRRRARPVRQVPPRRPRPQQHRHPRPARPRRALHPARPLAPLVRVRLITSPRPHGPGRRPVSELLSNVVEISGCALRPVSVLRLLGRNRLGQYPIHEPTALQHEPTQTPRGDSHPVVT